MTVLLTGDGTRIVFNIIYIYTRNLFVLYFGGWTLQKKFLSNQNKGHLGLGSRYIHPPGNDHIPSNCGCWADRRRNSSQTSALSSKCTIRQFELHKCPNAANFPHWPHRSEVTILWLMRSGYCGWTERTPFRNEGPLQYEFITMMLLGIARLTFPKISVTEEVRLYPSGRSVNCERRTASNTWCQSRLITVFRSYFHSHQTGTSENCSTQKCWLGGDMLVPSKV